MKEPPALTLNWAQGTHTVMLDGKQVDAGQLGFAETLLQFALGTPWGTQWAELSLSE